MKYSPFFFATTIFSLMFILPHCFFADNLFSKALYAQEIDELNPASRSKKSFEENRAEIIRARSLQKQRALEKLIKDWDSLVYHTGNILPSLSDAERECAKNFITELNPLFQSKKQVSLPALHNARERTKNFIKAFERLANAHQKDEQEARKAINECYKLSKKINSAIEGLF